MLASLREQWAIAAVSEREVRNEFFYNAKLTLNADCQPIFVRGGAVIDDVRVEVVGLEEPLDLRLEIIDGVIERLNGSSPGPWPEPLQVIRVFYVGGPNGTLECPTRDLEWALRNVLRQQAEPVRLFLDDLPEQEDFWELVQEHVPDYGSAKTVQGEIVRAVMRVVAEFHRNGCGNWPGSSFYNGLVTFLLTYLCDGTLEPECEAFARELIGQLQTYGECDFDVRSPELERVLLRDLDLLHRVAAAWCQKHPELIPWQASDEDSCGVAES
ncbi:MAG: hypothetical protein U0792_04285 [Gemmataceae bacterium]